MAVLVQQSTIGALGESAGTTEYYRSTRKVVLEHKSTI